MDYIKHKLSLLTSNPGCYLMKNKDNVIIYVGKAKNLKKRVSSYFRGTHAGKTAKLVSEISDFEYIAVNSEVESLILENNLIKKYNPKYNILLKDDKSYPYIELTDEEVPRLKIVRTLSRKKNIKHLYGPYPNVTAARGVVNLLNRMYPIRKCNTYGSKPCLYYYIGQCLGYCNNQYEKEYELIPLKHLNTLCNYFHVSLDYIFGFTNILNYPHSHAKINYQKAGERLKEFRKEHKLTQTTLGNELNCSYGTIAGYEIGRYLIATPFLYTICKKYHISADYLLGKINNPKYLD